VAPWSRETLRKGGGLRRNKAQGRDGTDGYFVLRYSEAERAMRRCNRARGRPRRSQLQFREIVRISGSLFFSRLATARSTRSNHKQKHGTRCRWMNRARTRRV